LFFGQLIFTASGLALISNVHKKKRVVFGRKTANAVHPRRTLLDLAGLAFACETMSSYDQGRRQSLRQRNSSMIMREMVNGAAVRHRRRRFFFLC